MEQDHVTAYSQNANLATYRSVAVRGGVDKADPHGMVLMLMDAALERMAIARSCMERGEIARKAKLLHSCVTIIAELRGSLNMAAGGALAQNLSELYDYMLRQLLLANANSDVNCIAAVRSLLDQIRGAWAAIEPQVRLPAPATGPAAGTGAGSSQLGTPAISGGNARG